MTKKKRKKRASGGENTGVGTKLAPLLSVEARKGSILAMLEGSKVKKEK